MAKRRPKTRKKRPPLRGDALAELRQWRAMSPEEQERIADAATKAHLPEIMRRIRAYRRHPEEYMTLQEFRAKCDALIREFRRRRRQKQR